MSTSIRLIALFLCAAQPSCDQEPSRSTWRYDVSLRLSSQQVLASNAEIAGQVELVAVESGRVVARFVTLPSAPGQAARQRAAELKQAIVAEYEKGMLRGIRFQPDSSSDTRRLWGQIATMLQFPEQAAQRWTAEERDDTGAYRAEYLVAPDRSVIKHKLGYEKTPTPVSVVKSDWRLKPVDGSPWAEATAEEQLELASLTGLPIRITLNVSAKASAGQKVEELPADAPLTEPLIPPHAFVTTAEVSRQHDLSVTSGMTVRSLVAEWRATNDTARRVLLGGRLAALLRVDPSAIASLQRLVAADATLATLAFRALSEAATAASQRALLENLGSATLAEDQRLKAAHALAASARADAQVCDELARTVALLSGDLKSAGLLAYGAWLKRLRDQKDPNAARHVRDLIAATQASKSNALEYARYLDALGNSGAPESESALVKAVAHSDDKVREIAVTALRALPTGSAERVIADAMLHDVAPRVRAAAVLAASFRPIEAFVPTLREVLRVEPRPHVRKRAIAWIATEAKGAPALREIIVRQAKNDPDPGVREQCQKLLSGSAGDPGKQ